MEKNLMYPYIISENQISIYKSEGEISIFKDENSSLFKKVISFLKLNDKDNIDAIIDDLSKINEDVKKIVLHKNIVYKDGVLFYKNKVVETFLSRKIIELVKNKYTNIKPIINFMNNVMQNPSEVAIQELYTFLNYGKLPLTEDGYFIAYKKVNKNYKDIHSNTYDNSVGEVVKMNREEVDDNRYNTCSRGLHFCSKDYLKEFGNSSSDIVVLLKINPKDVVSIPIDYNNTKGRCCKYKVINTYTDEDLLDNFYYTNDDVYDDNVNED